MADSDKKHLILPPEYFARSDTYLYPGPRPRTKSVNPQDRVSHSESLISQVAVLARDMTAARAIQEKAQIEMDYGLLVEIESFDGIGEVFEKAEFTKKSDLRNIRCADGKTYATVFIPDGELPRFEKKIQDYINYRKRKDGRAFDNQPLLDTIRSLKKATVQAIWTDTIPLPVSDEEVICWEVWLAIRDNREKQKEVFTQNAKALEIEVSSNYIDFRDRTVLLARGTKAQFEHSLELLNNIAELRKAKTTADFFTDLSTQDQKQWFNDLLPRIKFSKISDIVPYICILDTGVNSGHPLLANSITMKDLSTINAAWGKGDAAGHGTLIAGLALLGDLTPMLDSKDFFEVAHRLESSKLINDSVYKPDTDRPLDLYADYTQQAVSQAEIANPSRARIFQLAITTNDNRDKGRHSSWSSALDKLSFGSDNYGDVRLCIVSAGNVDLPSMKKEFPEFNKEEGVQDPAQAWNVISVGAYTEKDVLSPDERIGDSTPAAMHGELSPYSTTSFAWDNQWPYKPDIVMEGGNAVRSKETYGYFQANSLSLLTTHYLPENKYFTPMWATSAASALASRMCAQIMSEYPELRPETIRGLLVHSANWTPAMLRQFNCDKYHHSKRDFRNLLRICGFGVPNLTRALVSLKNNFTLLAEDSIQPFQKKGASIKYNEMKFYELPFPKQELEALGAAEIEMRITLSYFIEPNPSSRSRSNYYYKSHGLRFDIKTPTESIQHFKGRITKSLQEENEDYKNDEADTRWTFGIRNRTKGSLHSDIWRGTAAELASCTTLAVYPIRGWWGLPKNKDMVNNKAKYSLIISVKTSADVDIMSSVQTIIETKIKSDISIQID